MRTFIPAVRTACALAVLLSLACGEPQPTTLTISATPSSLVAGPGNFVTLTVTGTYDGKPLLEDSEIVLGTDLGSFAEDSDESSTLIVIKGRKATARLYAPRLPGVTTVTASHVDLNSVEATATVKVEIKAPTVTSLYFSCAAKNIGVLLTGMDTPSRCDVSAEDSNQERVAGAEIGFLAEAGGFRWGDFDEDARRKLAYVPQIGNRQPQDVAPFGDAANGEPRWIDASSNGRVRNPRDGMVTLVAYVKGDNQSLPCGPGDTDACSEPYVDANDNDRYDPGEEYIDVNGDGEWSASQDTVIWKQIKVLWTGGLWPAPASSARFLGADQNPHLERTQKKTVVFQLLDQNLNVLASNDANDNIFFTIDAGVIEGTSIFPLFNRNLWGIQVDDRFRIVNRDKRASYMIDSTYQALILNNRTDDDPQPQHYEFFGTLSRSPLLDEDGAPAGDNGVEETPHMSGNMK